MKQKSVVRNSIIFCIALYAIFIVEGIILYNNKIEYFLTGLLSTMLIASLIGIINIIKCIYLTLRHYKNEYYLKNLKKATGIIKIVTIPVYIFNFLLFSVLTGAMINPFLLVIAPVVAVIGIILAISMLIVTSTYSIVFIIALLLNNKISKKEAMIYGLTQIIFVLDIIGIILIFKKLKTIK